MTFHEKLKKRVQELSLNKSKAARDVGLPESTISSYLAKDKSLPRIDIALKIASALSVPLDWLADDAKGWPPPEPETPLRERLWDVPYGDLIRELARRYRMDLMDAISTVTDLAKEDWPMAMEEARRYKSGDKPSAQLAHFVLRIGKAIDAVNTTDLRYHVQSISQLIHDQLPGSEFSAEEFKDGAIQERYLLMMRGVPGAADFAKWLSENIGIIKATSDSEKRNADWGIDVILKLLTDKDRTAI